MGNQEGYRAVLKNKSFLSLWLAQIFSQLGDRVCFVVFVAEIAHNIGNTTSYQSWLYVAFTIPAILFTAIAGVFIDRWNKKYTLIITNILRGGIILLLPFFDSTLLGLYLLAFLISSVTQFFVPAEATCIPMLVEKKHLLSANSLFTTTMMASLIFGFVLGDPLINLFGLKAVHFSVAGLFIISALLLLGVIEKPIDHSHDRQVKDFLHEFKQGFIYIKETPIVFNAMMKLATLFSVIIALCILAISISSNWLYPTDPALGAQKFAYIVAYSGLGMVIGSVLVVKLWRKRSKMVLIFTGFSIIGIGLLFLAATKWVPQNPIFHIPVFFDISRPFDLSTRMIYTYLLATVVGFGSGLIAIPVQTILQSSIPEQMRGKVFGVQFTLLSTSSTLPVILVAYAVDWFGVSSVLIFIGLLLLIFGIYGFYNLWKKL